MTRYIQRKSYQVSYYLELLKILLKLKSMLNEYSDNLPHNACFLEGEPKRGLVGVGLFLGDMDNGSPTLDKTQICTNSVVCTIFSCFDPPPPRPTSPHPPSPPHPLHPPPPPQP